MMPAIAQAEQPKALPWDARCRACGTWLAAVPGCSEWVRVRCGNRRYNGQEGRKCPLYAQQQTVKIR